jgi:cell division protein FtsW (lipid II flippase)
VFWTVFIIVWVILSTWPARVADRKGHSFFAYFFFGLVLWPVALFVAYRLEDRSWDAMLAQGKDSGTPSNG